MTSTVPGFEFRRLTFDLPSVGGYGTAIEMGPQDRPVDIVFSHANGFNALTYRSILGPLSDRLRILAIDPRGPDTLLRSHRVHHERPTKQI